MYDNLNRGWLALVLLAAGMMAFGMVVSFCFTGDRPFFDRILGRVGSKEEGQGSNVGIA